MVTVFSLNAYLGLKDTSLSKLQPVHETANLLIAIIDMVAASILIIYGQGRVRWVFLSGIAWPVAFLLSLAADIESRLCLFTNTNCFATIGDSYQYLIFGDASRGWELWKYTVPTIVSLLLVIMFLTAVYCWRSSQKRSK